MGVRLDSLYVFCISFSGPSEVSLELIATSGGIRFQVMAEICQTVLDGI